jgi:hypothetical protein
MSGLWPADEFMIDIGDGGGPVPDRRRTGWGSYFFPFLLFFAFLLFLLFLAMPVPSFPPRGQRSVDQKASTYH